MKTLNELPKRNTTIDHANSAQSLRRALTLLSFVVVPTAFAAPLDLAKSPLFLDSSVKPNIFLMSDDSGSMDWNMVTSEFNGIMYAGSCTYPYTHPHNGAVTGADSPAKNIYLHPDTNRWYVTPTEEALKKAKIGTAPYSGVWRAWNKDYNALYYNPDVTYSPWMGKDIGGNSYTNASPTAAPLNPYRPDDGTQNLTVDQTYASRYCPTDDNISVTFYPALYFVWTDTDNNGVVDAADGHTLVEIKPTGISKCTSASDLPRCLKRDYVDEIQNFANWFTYYRKRDLTMKNAMTKVVAPSTKRMGMSTIHNRDTIGVPIKDIDDITLPVDTTAQTNKATLLARIGQITPGGGTPLLAGLDNVGKYFSGVSQTALFGSAPDPLTPILSKADGGACQQNFAVLMTDGYYTDSISSVGNADADGASPDTTGNTIFDGGAYADTYENTLADVAMTYYERDLSTLENKVKVVAGIDEATHQHLVTFGVAFGVNGTLAANPPNRTAAFTWPMPTVSTNNPERIDDLRHAAYNGRGEFLNAKSPDELATSLSESLSAIDNRVGSAAAVAVNSRSLNTETALYQARFDPSDWSGDLRAISVNLNGGIGNELWSAKAKLIAQHWDTGRRIITWNGSAGTPFRWNDLSASQKAALKDAGDATDARGQERLNYLRGDDDKVNKIPYSFRERKDKFKLGDIANSSPIYVGAPPYLPALETTAHATFRSTVRARTAMVYVGANDGMLHGFEAATGNERIAYVPNLVFENLKLLTSPTYGHRYYVDGSPTAADAFGTFATCPTVTVDAVTTTPACWRTILVGSLAGGGKGIFALDVTDPAVFDAENTAAPAALWEYLTVTTPSPGVDPDLGFGYGQPAITKLANGKWAAIFGNGYNSARGHAVLYIVDIVTGAVIEKIDTGAGTSTTPNGLSSPAVADVDGDYVVDYVYAGDLEGNLWKFNLKGNSTSTWKVAYNASGKPAPLIKAVDSSGSVQAITSRPEIGKHPIGPGYMVYFGTGRYIATDDSAPKTVPRHTFYGVWDKDGNNTQVARVDLLSQTISAQVPPTTRTVTDTAIVWRTGASGAACNTSEGTCLGWAADLPDTGEMSVSNPTLVGGDIPRVIFTTLIPEGTPCSAGGKSWLMELKPSNGGRPDASRAILDTDGDGSVTNKDLASAIGVQPDIGVMPEPTIVYDATKDAFYKLVTGSTGAIKSIINDLPSKPGRASWRQLK